MPEHPPLLSFSDSLHALGRVIPYYPTLAKVVGINESLFLIQLIYWSPKARDSERWVYKSAAEFEEELSFSYFQQQRVRKSLLAAGLLEESYDREEHRMYFRVAKEKLDQVMAEHLRKPKVPPENKGNKRSGKNTEESGTSGNSIGHLKKLDQPPEETQSRIKEHKITQETTQEKTVPFSQEREAPVLTSCGKAAKSAASPPDFGEYLPLDLPAKEPLPAKQASNDAMLFPQESLVSPSTAPSTALVPVAVPLLKLEELDSRALLGTFPCVGTRKTWGYTQRDQYEWELAFPGIDVAQELRSMWIWCKSNPKLIKTYNGMPRFIAAWLTKAQNSIGGQYGTAALQRTRSSGNFSVAEERIRKQQDKEGGHRPGPHVHQSRV